MAIEKFSNTGVSTLSSSIDNSTTSVPVTSASTFPSTGNFRIRCGTEIMLVTSVSGSTFTVTRAQESTSAASHSSGATVYHVLSAGSFNQFRLDNISSGNYSSLLPAGQAGRIYRGVDSVMQFQDNGATWQGYGGPNQLLAPLASSDYTWVNQNSATSDFTGGTLLMTTTTSGSGHNVLYKTVTPPFTVTVNYILFGSDSASFNSFNLWFWSTSAGKGSNIQTSYNAGVVELWAEKWNSNLTFNSEYTHLSFSNVSGRNQPNWLRVVDDGAATRYYQYSYDGVFFVNLFTVARTDYITPDSVAISIRKDAANSTRKTVRVLGWYQTSP